ncbi:hypothetical protein BGZ83_007887 [Gryganskiella cystojenkinii]|nr:hypothetical protein BGZ83_007887 [Gryganskiella cystojenkinii]
MGRKHLQAQAQLSFLQQQQSNPSSPIISGPPLTPLTPPGSGSLHGHRTLVSDLSQASLLASIAAVAATSLSKPVATTSNSKNNRRFTVQANNIKEDELTLEQRKCEFLLDQIANLQRGYDTLRQEKSTLEIQLDLMQRQHQYHQQQRQKRRSSQRRTLGHDQSQALSLALTGAANSLPQLNESRTVGHENKLGMIPSTPLTSTFLSPEAQAQEVARIQYELAQAQLREEEEERQVEAQRRAAEEAEREARRLRRQKSMHLKEALASLESKRARSDSGHVQFSSAEDLKHLEQLQLFNQQPQQQLSSQHEESRRPSPSATATPQQLEPKQPLRLQLSPVTLTFQSAAAAAAAAGRKILSPFSPRVETTSSSSSSHSDSAPPLTPLFSPTVSSTSPAVSSPASSSSSSPSLSLILSKSGTATSTANNIKQPAALYTQSNNSRAQTPITTTTIAARSKGRYIPSTHTFSIEQCSCCIGGMIEL